MVSDEVIRALEDWQASTRALVPAREKLHAAYAERDRSFEPVRFGKGSPEQVAAHLAAVQAAEDAEKACTALHYRHIEVVQHFHEVAGTVP